MPIAFRIESPTWHYPDNTVPMDNPRRIWHRGFHGRLITSSHPSTRCQWQTRNSPLSPFSSFWNSPIVVSERKSRWIRWTLDSPPPSMWYQSSCWIHSYVRNSCDRSSSVQLKMPSSTIQWFILEVYYSIL